MKEDCFGRGNPDSMDTMNEGKHLSNHTLALWGTAAQGLLRLQELFQEESTLAVTLPPNLRKALVETRVDEGPELQSLPGGLLLLAGDVLRAYRFLAYDLTAPSYPLPGLEASLREALVATYLENY